MSVRQTIVPPGWKAPSGYAHGVSATGRVVVTAGQVGENPRPGQCESDDRAGQPAQALRNIAEILTAPGARPQPIVRLTWLVTIRAEYVKARNASGSA